MSRVVVVVAVLGVGTVLGVIKLPFLVLFYSERSAACIAHETITNPQEIDSSSSSAEGMKVVDISTISGEVKLTTVIRRCSRRERRDQRIDNSKMEAVSMMYVCVCRIV